MKLDVIYTCELCGAVSVDSVPISFGGARIDTSPICEHGIEHLTSIMDLHTRDERTARP